MQNEHHIEPENFQMVVNTFTQGLRELPTDYVARVKNFLAEYLGTSRHPVPFGGRVRDFERLDTWLADTEASPYLLLAAPAGRGKSALLLRWCQRLYAQRRNLAIAYFPVSIRFRTNLAGVAFPSLVALLASQHGEKVPADPNLHEDVWRSLLAEYLMRPLPDGRSLLLVLDGVDEAADWTAGPGLFPLEPPPGLRIVLSARYLANDQDAGAWLKRLGWVRPGLARTLELYPLDRTGIANVLLQMGFPLDLLSARVNIVSELYRLSEGDPLLVRLYVDDLWERGEAAVRFQPEDLHMIRPGLAGYFERWWKDQRLLWASEAPQREVTAQIVLNLLAGALGPLSRSDIVSLASDETDINEDEIEEHLAPLARFVTGDGVHQGYVFSHPRLANYFLEERLSDEERREIEQRFLRWGEQTLAALNTGALAPENASSYIVQYYGAHLERVQAAAPALLALISDGWRRAWEKLDRANAGFLGDVERAWRSAGREDSIASASGEPVPCLGGEVRSLLTQVSVNSMTANISPRLMLEAVKTGIWTPAQGLACIRLISDLRPRAREIVGLAPYVQEPLRTDILQEALDTIAAIKDDYIRLDTLVELAAGFSEELLWQVLEVLPTIEDEADRAGVLTELVPAISPYQALVARALDLAQEMEEEEYRALALEGLVPCFLEDQHAYIVQLVESIEEERYRAPVLKALIPHLSPALLENVLREVRDLRDGLARIRLLTELVPYLPTSLQTEVVQEALELVQDIEDREYRIEVLSKLIPFLPADGLKMVLEETSLLWDESSQVRVLSELLSYLTDELLPDFRRVALGLKNEHYRVTTVIKLLPFLSANLLEPLLDSIKTIWDEGYRAELLAHFARYATQDQVPRLLEIAATIKDQGYRIWLLAEFEVPMAGKLAGTYSDMLKAFDELRHKEERLQVLLAIVQRLSDEALEKIFDLILPDVFSFIWRIYGEEQQAYILVKLADRLPENWLPAVLEKVQLMRGEQYQLQALVALAPRIGKTLLSEVLDSIRAMKDREKRSQALEALVSVLPEERKAQRVQEMLQVLQIIKDERRRVQLIQAFISNISAPLPEALAQKIIVAIQAMRERRNKADTLKVVVPHMPQELLENVLDTIQDMQEERGPILEMLASYAPKDVLPRLLQMAQDIQNERWRTRAITAIMAHGPEELIVSLLEQIYNENWHTGILNALVPYIDEDTFYRLWDAMQALSDERTRVLVMGALVQRMPTDFFPQFWQMVQEIQQEEGRLWVLRALLAHMSEDLFEEVWNAVQAHKDQVQRERMQELLAARVPERFFSLVWEKLQASVSANRNYRIFLALAPHVPRDVFPQFLTTVLTISHEVMRAQLLEALAPQVPEAFFAQFLMAILELSNQYLGIRVVTALIPYIPRGFFWPTWETVRTMQGTKLLADMVVHAPRELLPRMWGDVRKTPGIAKYRELIQAFLPYLVQERFMEVLEMLYYLPHNSGLVDMLEVLVPLLSPEQCAQVLATVLPSQSEEDLTEIFKQANWERIWQLRTLAVLAPSLPYEHRLKITSILLQSIKVLNGEDQSWVLAKLASHVPEQLLKEMLETIWLLTAEHGRIETLEILLPTLSQEGWVKALELVKTQMRTTSDVHPGLELLNAASALTTISPSALLYSVLHDVLRLLSEWERRDVLPVLAHLISIVHVCGSEHAVMEGLSALVDVGSWWP